MKVELKKLKVETKSGVFLGKIKNVIIDTDSQIILQYEVGNLFNREYLISQEQVLFIDNQKMIVDDSEVKNENIIIDKKIDVESGEVAVS